MSHDPAPIMIRHGMFLLLEKLLRWSINPRLRARLFAMFGAKIGANVRIYEIQLFNLRNGFKNLTIGDNTHVGPGCRLDLEGNIAIGARSTLSPGVTILTHSDPGDYCELKHLYPRKIAGVSVGSDCWLGTNVTVLAGVDIANRCLVAAGSVVTSRVPPSMLIAGIPATVKKHLPDQ